MNGVPRQFCNHSELDLEWAKQVGRYNLDTVEGTMSMVPIVGIRYKFTGIDDCKAQVVGSWVGDS